MSKSKHIGEDECLDLFHEEIGTVLDSFATHHSLSYVEYSAYRALHTSRENSASHGTCESNNCVFGQLGFRFQHIECDSSDSSVAAAGHVTLAVFFLVLVMKGELDSLVDGRRSRDERQAACAVKINEMSDDIIARFRSVCVDRADLLPYDVMNRCHKLLEGLGLNRKMYLILTKGSPECTSSDTLTALETSGRILAECVGPLAASLARCGGNKQQQHHWELAVDSFVRGLAVFGRVREHQLQMEEPNCGEISSRTDNVLRGLFELCNDCQLESQLSEETLEKAAKVRHRCLLLCDFNCLATSFSSFYSLNATDNIFHWKSATG
jgi:hypothetical protein